MEDEIGDRRQNTITSSPPAGYLLREPIYALRLKLGQDLSITGSLKAGVYPTDWPDITYFIKHLAKWHCEHCGRANIAKVHRVLTTHHLNLIKSDCRWTNLVALCQRCHLYVQGTYVPKQLYLLDDFIPSWVLSRGIHLSSAWLPDSCFALPAP